MGFDVTKIFRKSKRTEIKSPSQTDTDSPSEGDFANNGGTITPRGAATTNTAASSTSSLWNLRSSSNNNQQADTPPASRGLRSKASRIGKGKDKEGKDSAGYFNGTTSSTVPPPGGNGAAQLEKLFDQLRNPEEDPANELGVESTMSYLTALGLNPETSDVFVALELVQAPSLGEITRKGFVDGWKAVGVSYQPCLTLAEQKAYIASRVRKFGTDPAYFKQVYRYTFAAGKEPNQRSMTLENAIEFWKVLFAAPGRPWTSRGSGSSTRQDWTPLWVQFLAEQWTRSVNRDMWNQTLEFATKSIADPSLGFWSEDGAWPGVIDDFVAWSRANGHAAQPAQAPMETD